MQKIWNIENQTDLGSEIKNLVKDEFLARLLVKRSIDTPKKIEDFLNPLKMEITSPYVFKDMQRAVERVKKAIDDKEKIVVWGDFDADGVTSTALVYKALKLIGADVDFYIPSRESENHGLNTKALVKLISQKKTKLIITVDCGISNVDEIAFANSFKVDTIITDHHEAPEVLPKAYAIINPKAPGALDESLDVTNIEYLSYLAGVGVAFKLVCSLLDIYKQTDFIDEILPLVAVGTIADIVPLLGENRCFVKCGLIAIESGKHKGLRKLLDSCGYDSSKGVTSEQIAFGVAPRINAAGRLATVDSALKLLITDKDSDIDYCCSELGNYNKIRQELCEETYEQAVQMVMKEPKDCCSVILFNPDWHLGIIGIVASKLVEKFNKPVFLMTKPEDSDIIRCSTRSVEGVNIHEVISENAEMLESFGGHSMAAGLTFDITKAKFEQIKQALEATVKEKLESAQIQPVLNIDMELSPPDLSFKLIDSVSILEPFGEKNANPLFAMNNLALKSFRTMGTNNNHMKVVLSSDTYEFEGVIWGQNTLPVKVGEKLDAAFYAKINEFNGNKIIQLDIQDLRYEAAPDPEIKGTNDSNGGLKIYDHTKKTDILAQVEDYALNCKQSILVFAEHKKIIEHLNRYKELSSRICSRVNLKKADQIMFFDYPSDKNLLNFILEGTKAKKIHLMSYNPENIDADEFIKNLSGMLKYAYNNKNGKINVSNVASFLSVSEKLISLALDLFNSNGIIEISAIEGEENIIRFKFLEPKELRILRQTILYTQLKEELAAIQEFRSNCMELKNS